MHHLIVFIVNTSQRVDDEETTKTEEVEEEKGEEAREDKNRGDGWKEKEIGKAQHGRLHSGRRR